MKKILSLLCVFMLSITIANANSIDRAISDSKINKSAISVSVRDITNGKVIYQLNENKPVNPASTLKVITLAASLSELGKNYEFSTELYKNTNNELFLKLGADPFLKSNNLKDLFKTARSKNIIEPKALYIDDTILDKNEWGEGWQWDDDLNPLMPKFGAYNIDGNILKIIVEPTIKGAPAEIKMDVFYPTTFVNLVTTDATNNIKVSRNNNIAPDVLNLEGTVAKREIIEIPINYLQRYLRLRLEDAISSAKIEYYGNITNKKVPTQNVYLVDKKTTPISKAIDEIMKNSNNMVAETVFKLAGAHHSNQTGSVENAIQMLIDYCQKIGVNASDIKVVDGSGVSKNNLVTADFMTSFLAAQYRTSEKYKDIFASAGEGTLKNRMLYMGDKLKAKTGTLTDISAITGYIETTKGNTFAFDIMINDAKSKPSEKKMLEEYILRALYSNY